MSTRFLAILGTFCLATSLHAQQALPKVPDGFKVELVLQAPDIEAPTALCVAPNGDVYFAEDPMDMAGPPTKNLDRIWMLKGGDPRKKTLIADKMWAVMGLEIVRDKLYVVHAPHVTVFTLDADGKPIRRDELFDDLGPPVAGLPGFNDHIPSGIRMGMDGWLYVSIGDKGIPRMQRKEKDQGSVHVAEGRWRHTKEGHYISLEGGGVIRFRPDGSGLEVFACGTRNHLDVPMDEHDRIFVRDNTDDGDGWNTRLMYLPYHAFMGYPWAFTRHPNETLPMIHDFGGGSPCGGWVYCDDGLPETYRGRIFHCEWGQGKVYAVKVVPDGAGFKYVDQITFMDPEGTGLSDFRPFTLRPTADGRGFYVTDWGFNGWSQPIKAGRLFKVTYVKGDVKPQPRGRDTDSIEQLIRSLDHPAHSERLRAQRALITSASASNKLIEEAMARGALSVRATQHALWVLKESGWRRWRSCCISHGLRNQYPDVRLEAVRILGDYTANNNSVVEALALTSLFNSEKISSVRLRLAEELGRINELDSTLLASKLIAEDDVWSRHGIIHALKHTADWEGVSELLDEASIKPGLAPDSTQREGISRLMLAFAGEFHPKVIAILEKLMQCQDATIRVQAVATLARVHHDRKLYAGTWWGTRPEQQKPPARTVEWECTGAVREALVRALSDKDLRVRRTAVSGLADMNDYLALKPLKSRFLQENDEDTRKDLVSAIAQVRLEDSSSFLQNVVNDPNNPEGVRSAAVFGLEKLATKKALACLEELAMKADRPSLQVAALAALGNLRAASGLLACTLALGSEVANVRMAGLRGLAMIGDATKAGLILPLLDDRESTVQLAAIQALGTLKARVAVPYLVKRINQEPLQFDAIGALAQIPDPRALSAYLTGLGSKNADLRQACRQALIAIREQIVSSLEELVKRNEIRADLLPELRSIYSSFSPILEWHLIGPFHNDGKEYPPEKEIKLDAAYVGSDKIVKWQTIRADAGKQGMIDLYALFTPNQSTVAYGYTEIESSFAREAQLQIGSDDTIVIWLNGQKVHQFLGDRAWAPDQEKANIHLLAGKNKLLVRCGNNSGPWAYSVAVSAEADRYAFLKGGKQKYDLEAFRVFARTKPGDAEHGRKLFLDLKGLACVKCHALAGQGGQVGPDLAGIALKYKREELMTSILEPSKTIAQGYETIIINTTKGTSLTGVFKGETADAVNLTDNEGKKHTVLKKDIEERSFSPVSTMPNGLSDGMTLQDFADIIAFLEARREQTGQAKK